MDSASQGRIFEVGFNLGILAGFKEQKIGHNWLEFYQEDLAKLKLKPFLKALIDENNYLSPLDQETISNWTQFLLWRGFLGGLNFLREYLKSAGWYPLSKPENLEILYYQCCFRNENSMGLNHQGEEPYLRDLLAHFRKNVNSLSEKNLDNYVNNYQRKGEFLKADTLILFRYRQRKYTILAVDTSLFSLRMEREIMDSNYLDLIRKKIVREVNYFRSKSVFSHLRIDTGNDSHFDFSRELKKYFTAFKYQDKESSKLIQAAGYSYSFANFLEKIGLFTTETEFIISAIGYTDRYLSSMTVNKNNWQLLKPCYEIYKYDSSDQDIEKAREEVIDFIKRKARSSFTESKQFINELVSLQPNETKVIIHQEKLTDFANTAGEITSETKYNIEEKNYNPVGKSLRNAHADLIKQALVSDELYVFLTGNPGIGKTTAIAQFLKEHSDEGFLFFYVSPRTQVNLDIIEKFKKNQDNDHNKFCENLFCLNTNSQIIDNNKGRHTVKYFAQQKQENDNFTSNNVDFIIDSSDEESHSDQINSATKRETEDLVIPTKLNFQGVIDSLCQGIYALIHNKTSHQIVASAAIQALKKTRDGNTLKHFGNIFQDAYINKQKSVIPEKMREISQRIKHIFIMVDEITGDDSGAEFLKEIKVQLRKYELLDKRHGFNPKIIVADASIVDKNVVKQHLEESQAEPDKIFFRKAANDDISLSLEKMQFNGLPATIINTNSYPAKSLKISYKVILHSTLFPEKDTLKYEKDKLQEKLAEEIIKDIEKLAQEAGQILVYIQNKQKLEDLITKLKKLTHIFPQFNENEEYITINANISEKQKKDLPKYFHDVKIIFMTSSGSRGLSFPKVKHILVDIPRFQVEKNLMEIIQVIYRGRGDKDFDQQDKQLIFYLAEKAVYYQDKNIELSLQESLMSVLNILLLLKAAILTRIKGAGKIGNHNFLIIPIGGKSISSAGESLTKGISNLLRELKNEYRINRSHKDLEIADQLLQELLKKADFVITPETKNPQSYLNLMKTIGSDFSELLNHGFDNLLTYSEIESGYITGNLLIISAKNHKLEETYLCELEKLLKHSEELLSKLEKINKNPSYHDNLRFATKNAIDLVRKLRGEKLNRSQKFQQSTQKDDEYYAIPLFTFLNTKNIKSYLEKETEKETQDTFRYILEQYVRSLYSLGNVLPLGENYSEFPFIFFSSYSLEEIRNNMLTDKYLFNSNELNILNLID